jgi:hypothetical protein
LRRSKAMETLYLVCLAVVVVIIGVVVAKRGRRG